MLLKPCSCLVIYCIALGPHPLLMGNSSSVEMQPPQLSASTDSSPCPVVGQSTTLPKSPTASTASRAPESACPVPEQYRGQAVYNVYNQRIDPGSAKAGAPVYLCFLSPQAASLLALLHPAVRWDSARNHTA